MIYVGSAEDATQDQTLEEVMVGPVPVGNNKFVLQAPAPDPTNIPNADLIGVTVVLVTCSFMDNEFVRIGYYVNNEYSEPYEEGTLPNPVDIHKLRRNILAAEPRVTRFAIDWTGNGNGAPLEGDGEEVVVGDDEDEGMDLNEMEDDEEDMSDEDLEGNDDDEIDIDDEGEAEGGEEDAQDGTGVASPASLEMIHEDSNSMDVGMMQSTARLY